MNTPAFWSRNNALSRSLWPLSLLYGAGAWADRQLHTPQAAPLAVLSIGNATAGGAGKTPTVLALLPLLHALGQVPHILTRGYKAAHPLHAHRVGTHEDWRAVGDEALLLARAAPTWAGRDRLASAQAAARAGATIAICDDALQHYRLKKTLSLMVIDGPYGIGNGRLIPAGPLREPFKQALSRCDGVILIGEDRHALAQKIDLPIFTASLEPSNPVDFLSQQRWLAFAGIGRPQKFYDTLQALHAPIAATRDFPDHHPYSHEELQQLQLEAIAQGARLITTEKDAVKLPDTLRDTVATLPIRLNFHDAPVLQQFLTNRLAAA